MLKYAEVPCGRSVGPLVHEVPPQIRGSPHTPKTCWEQICHLAPSLPWDPVELGLETLTCYDRAQALAGNEMLSQDGLLGPEGPLPICPYLGPNME